VQKPTLVRTASLFDAVECNELPLKINEGSFALEDEGGARALGRLCSGEPFFLPLEHALQEGRPDSVL
jgi:hypothetical protein